MEFILRFTVVELAEMAGVFHCAKECVFCNVIDHLVCWLGIACNGCISHIVQW